MNFKPEFVYTHADGNGTVTALVNSGGALQASYNCDPYGQWLSRGGTLASANGLRFSSKPWVGFAGSTTSGLYYYGYRFYDPYLQRWVNRDPIGERGGMNLYVSVNNTPLNIVDAFGLRKWCGTCEMGGGGYVVGIQVLLCDLTSPCGSKGSFESIHVRAWFFSISASPLPANATRFRTCFEVPDGFDTDAAFTGSARYVSFTASAGRGRSAGKIVLGDAESEGVESTSGIDLSASFGGGRSHVESHSDCLCNK